MFFAAFYDFESIWEGLGSVLGGFGERFGRIWGGFWEGSKSFFQYLFSTIFWGLKLFFADFPFKSSNLQIFKSPKSRNSKNSLPVIVVSIGAVGLLFLLLGLPSCLRGRWKGHRAFTFSKGCILPSTMARRNARSG